MVGAVGFGRQGEDVEIGYWIARAWWGHGFATEAAQGLLAIGRMLGHTRLVAGHFVDNPASGAVLRKIGFLPTGTMSMRRSLARGGDAPLVEYGLTMKRGPTSPNFRALPDTRGPPSSGHPAAA